ncbi:hypothetical protein EYF80_065640 [Liparis tanakae]|uniref:Uncharacterized protein n=1 Tax=Liparis tanakae TaxID=230148 RepID=A0A4Z2E669_9TELE|nr:hypothetical protein EYF80_065640 [Liparis tanakae]
MLTVLVTAGTEVTWDVTKMLRPTGQHVTLREDVLRSGLQRVGITSFLLQALWLRQNVLWEQVAVVREKTFL